MPRLPTSFADHPAGHTDTMPDPVFLHPDVSYCRLGGMLVFLDTARDRYFCLNGQQSEWFSQIEQAPAGQPLPAGPRAFADRLVQACVLTRDPGKGPKIEACNHPPASGSLFDTLSRSPARIRDMPRFLGTLLACSGISRKHGVHETLGAVRRLKARIPRQPPCAADERVRTFHALAPYFITSHDACLYRSLLLIHYLAGQGLAADWVFGVRLSPFCAHSWVERDGQVLNDRLDTVREYAPILSV